MVHNMYKLLGLLKCMNSIRELLKKNPPNTRDFGCQINISYIFNIHVQFQLTLLSVTQRQDLDNLGFKYLPDEFRVLCFTCHCNQRRKILLMLEQELTNPASVCFLLFWMPERFYQGLSCFLYVSLELYTVSSQEKGTPFIPCSLVPSTIQG